MRFHSSHAYFPNRCPYLSSQYTPETPADASLEKQRKNRYDTSETPVLIYPVVSIPTHEAKENLWNGRDQT
jgi:hypothetical protein